MSIASRPFERRCIQLMRHIRPAVMRWAVQVGCILSLNVPLVSGGRPHPDFNPLQRGWVYRPAPEAPFLRGIPTGSEAFLEMPGACGQRPCAWTHPKKGLVPYSSGWWDGGQIPSLLGLCIVQRLLSGLSGIRAGRLISSGLKGPFPRL